MADTRAGGPVRVRASVLEVASQTLTRPSQPAVMSRRSPEPNARTWTAAVCPRTERSSWPVSASQLLAGRLGIGDLGGAVVGRGGDALAVRAEDRLIHGVTVASHGEPFLAVGGAPELHRRIEAHRGDRQSVRTIDLQGSCLTLLVCGN